MTNPSGESPVEERLQRAIADRYRLGPVIGEGGMATVYRAEDVRHHRAVALKVLRPELAAVLGAERFLSEIRVTANLQHPHLLPLFDSGEADGLLYYVMPFVEGETLRARLERERQLPVGEAIRIAVAIAGALDYAHRHGVIHRDLKPENVLMHDGEPLVADFGIALAVSRAGGERITQTGMSLGTPQYMSPEQAAAERTIDGRSDIYALGALLYEMLTGDPPHTGSTMQAVIARVLTEVPRSARLARSSVPESVADALDRALAKVPADRYDTAQQFAQALTTGASPAPRAFGTQGALPRGRVARAALLAVGAAVIIAVGGLAWRFSRPEGAAAGPVLRVVMKALPDAAGPATISVDGKHLVYVGISQGKRMVFVRPIDEFRAQPIAGTEDAVHLFVSPDGKSLGYFSTDDRMRRVSLQGGVPTLVLSAFRFAKASWGGAGDGTIVTDFAKLDVLSWVRPGDGRSGLLSTLDSARGEIGHFNPVILPDGQNVVFEITHSKRGMQANGGELGLVSLADAQHGAAPHTSLGVRGRDVFGYVDGWLLYGGEDPTSLLAVRLDLERRRVEGRPVLVLQDPAGVVGAHIANDGTLLYSHQSSSDNQALVVDTGGVGRPMFEGMTHGPYMNPRLSRDGRRMLIQGTSPEGSDIWLHDLASGTSSRLTNNGTSLSPAWSNDGTRMLYVSMVTAHSEMMSQPLDGRTPATLLFSAPEILVSEGFAPDGHTLVFQRQMDNVWSIWSRDVNGDHPPVPVIRERFDNYMPALSPDGRWLAYTSTSTGHHEIYVVPYPATGSPVQVSESGGTEPAWSRDGRRLLYRNGNQVLAAAIGAGAGFSVTERRALFRHTYEGEMPHANYAPLPDGRMVMIGASAGGEPDMVMVVNWFTELRARLPH